MIQEKQIGETFIFPLDGSKIMCVDNSFAVRDDYNGDCEDYIADCKNCVLCQDKCKLIDNCEDFVGFCQGSFRADKKDVIFKIVSE